MQSHLSHIEAAHNHGIELKETNASITGVKAVFAFMDGQDNKVVDLLMSGIKSMPLDEDLWRLNLDMLRVLDDQHTFDQLSIKFAEKFDMSPPAWSPIKAAKEEIIVEKVIYDVTVKILTVDKISMTRLLNPVYEAAEKGGVITFDFNGVGNSDKDGLIILSNGLLKLVEMQSDIKFIFFDKFIKAISEHAKKSGKDLLQLWDMSFLMMRVSGMEELFEEFSIAYAGEFDIMPAVWERYIPSSKVAEIDELSIEHKLSPIEGAIVFNGKVNVISPVDIHKIESLLKEGKLIIDMRSCIRIGLIPAEIITNLINKSIRPVLIIGAHDLVQQSLKLSTLLPLQCVIFKDA